MYVSLSENITRAIVERAARRKYGVSVRDLVRLIKDGTVDDENLRILAERLAEWHD